jgi:hypothetical protein
VGLLSQMVGCLRPVICYNGEEEQLEVTMFNVGTMSMRMDMRRTIAVPFPC